MEPADSTPPFVPTDPSDRAARLEAWALEAGFDRAGVASLEPIERGGVFRRWLERGDHAGMGWLERRVDERLEPARLLAGARSALCVALRYAPLAAPGGGGEAAAEPEGDLWPRVARYSRGRDYHNLMGKRLRKLARRIREAFPGCDTRAYVDTGPVLERELAARAGLGVQGKNTCLLSRDGSYFLLGELLLTLELAPDAPLADLCGRCTRCLDACPTGALPEPYRLDANRCISYWTIEHRGAIPDAVRGWIGDWVFGCDVCQEVCPWNQRRQEPADHPDLHTPAERAALDLPALLALDPATYRERFRGSAMQRARLEGLKRNAAVAMGNRGDRRYAAALANSLAAEPEPMVRRHAAWALGRLGGAPARRALARAAADDPDPEVAAEARRALDGLPAVRAIE
jgi:epoxyqueuosine reductase